MVAGVDAPLVAVKSILVDAAVEGLLKRDARKIEILCLQ
jgi:hypothetical protein